MVKPMNVIAVLITHDLSTSSALVFTSL